MADTVSPGCDSHLVVSGGIKTVTGRRMQGTGKCGNGTYLCLRGQRVDEGVWLPGGMICNETTYHQALASPSQVILS